MPLPEAGSSRIQAQNIIRPTLSFLACAVFSISVIACAGNPAPLFQQIPLRKATHENALLPVTKRVANLDISGTRLFVFTPAGIVVFNVDHLSDAPQIVKCALCENGAVSQGGWALFGGDSEFASLRIAKRLLKRARYDGLISGVWQREQPTSFLASVQGDGIVSVNAKSMAVRMVLRSPESVLSVSAGPRERVAITLKDKVVLVGRDSRELLIPRVESAAFGSDDRLFVSVAGERFVRRYSPGAQWERLPIDADGVKLIRVQNRLLALYDTSIFCRGHGALFEYDGIRKRFRRSISGLRRVNGVASDQNKRFFISEQDCAGYGPSSIDVYSAASLQWRLYGAGLANNLGIWKGDLR